MKIIHIVTLSACTVQGCMLERRGEKWIKYTNHKWCHGERSGTVDWKTSLVFLQHLINPLPVYFHYNVWQNIFVAVFSKVPPPLKGPLISFFFTLQAFLFNNFRT